MDHTGLGNELARLRAEVEKQVKLRVKAAEELGLERQNLLEEFTKKWGEFQTEVAEQVRLFETLKSEAMAEWQKIESEKQDLGRREFSLLDLRTSLATWNRMSGRCPTCGAAPESPSK